MIYKWDKRFLEMAKLVSEWSKDPSTKVGAVIVDTKNRIVSVGFNGYPSGIRDEGLDNREDKYPKIVHAEINAILFANRNIINNRLYVYPLLPCARCMAVIIQTGISQIFVQTTAVGIAAMERSPASYKTGLEMAKEANIEIVTIEA